MNTPTIIKLLSTSLFAVLTLSHAAAETKAATYKNEQQIEFSTMDGKTTLAFEGSIQVPENRNNPKSRTIPVHYVRFPSTAKKPGHPIVYLSGGPGGSGIQTAKYPNFRFPLFMALREFADVIALDQRGTGASKVVPKCHSSQTIPLNAALTDAQVAQKYKLAADECVEFWRNKGADALGYTSIQSALDINDLRQHLKADKVTLWGISYGSHLAFTSLKVMEKHIDKIVIASAEGLNQTVKYPFATDAYFQRLQTAINSQPQAAKMYPDIISLIKRVHNKLEQSPIPSKIPLKDGSHLDFLFQKRHMQMMASGMIADPQRGVANLLAMYNGLDQDEHSVLDMALKSGYFNNEKISLDIMSFAMDVASGVTDKRLALIEQQAKTSLLGLYLNFPMPHLNKSAAGLDLGDTFRQDPQSDVPTLLLSGTLDGRTYIDSQKESVRGLTHLKHVTVKNAGHNLFMVSPQVTNTIKKFLANETIELDEIEIALPNFVLEH